MLGVCYYPEQWPEEMWADDAARMKALGLTYVRIGEFAWAKIEPGPGRADFAWLDRAVEILGDAGLKIVLGTPTAAPPVWLTDLYPEILPVDRDGRRRRAGGRRHTDFSSPIWWRESARIVTVLAERYGGNPHVAGWQIDNEFGCHDTTQSYSDAALQSFRRWLADRYGDIDALNRAWGTTFWSATYRSFDEVGLPNLVVAEPAPMHLLDFRRCSSDRVAGYCAMQAEIIRERSPGRFITHNFMSFFFDFDPFAVAASLDFASFDSYPLGMLDVSSLGAEEKRTYARTGHPDLTSFGCDFYRAACLRRSEAESISSNGAPPASRREAGGGKFWIMEQQPGPINWAAHNPAPASGAVRLWTLQALAHGAEVVSYFRWRQLSYSHEQMHSGLNRPDNVLDQGGEEARRVAGELRELSLETSAPAPAALLFDIESEWMFGIQPQVREFSYGREVVRWYSTVRALGLDVDIVPAGADLSPYRLVLVPSVAVIRPAMLERLRSTDAIILYGPRTGSKTEHFAIPPNLPPGPLQEILPLKVVRVDSLRPDMPIEVRGEVEGAAVLWRELVETELSARAAFDDGGGAYFSQGRHYYLACRPDDALLSSVTANLAEAIFRAERDLLLEPLAAGLRLRRRGDLTFAFNFGQQPIDVPAPSRAKFVLGARRLESTGVAAWRTPRRG
jgi:beta-galactosidase